MKLKELTKLRTYNSKTFLAPNGKELIAEFHIKPIHYFGVDGDWHDLDEIASYFGNRGGMVLKEGWENKVDFQYLVWYQKRQKLIKGKGIWIKETPSFVKRPLLLNLSLTAFPDPNPGTTSMDGWAGRNAVTEDWATIRAGAGTSSAADDALRSGDDLEATATTDKYAILRRAAFLFDTSSLGSGASVSAATFGIVVQSKADNLGGLSLSLVTCTPASNTTIANADYANFGTTKQATDLTIASITADDTTYNTWTLDATGRSNVSVTGISKFALRKTVDLADSPTPTWSSTQQSAITSRWADQAGTTQDPKLIVTYTAGVVGGSFLRALLGVG